MRATHRSQPLWRRRRRPSRHSVAARHGTALAVDGPGTRRRRETRGRGGRPRLHCGIRAMAEMKPERERADTVGADKALLKRVLDTRPSGTRHRLAIALGKNRSFISQIANPVYAVPIPLQHLETIFEICHFTAADRREFLAAYAEAHPRRLDVVRKAAGTRKLTLTVPDLGDARRNRLLDETIAEIARRLARFSDDQ